MKRWFIVLFVLISTITFAQANSPETHSFASIVDYVRNFDFIASGTALPAIQSSGMRFILWNNNKPLEYISNGSEWVLQKPTKYTSAGATQVPTFTDNGDGTIQVNACCVALYPDTNFSELPDYFTFSPATFTLSEGINYIIANYNSGSPIIQKTSDVSIINESTIVPLFTIYRHDNHNHALNWDSLSVGLTNKLHQRLVKTQRFARESGLTITTNPDLTFSVSSGVVWYGATKENLEEVVSTSDYVRLITPIGSYTTIIALNNTHYVENNSLVELNPNKYAVNWIYRSIEMNKTIYVMLGAGNYSLEEATNSNPPPTPAVINNLAILVAKVIYIKDSTTPLSIQSAFDRYYSYNVQQSHNNLSGLNVDGYQHLTEIEKDTALNGSETVDLKSKDLTVYGEFNLDENHLVYDDNAISFANVKLPTANEPTWTSYKGSEVLSFSPTQTNLVYFSTQLPHRYHAGSNIEFHIHVAYPTTAIATSTWEFTYSWASINSNFPTETTVTKQILSSGVIDKHTMSMIAAIDGTGKTESSILVCSLKRLGADANDTYANSIYFISADFHIPINKLGEPDGHF